MFKSKTIYTGIAVAILGLLETFKITDFAEYIPDNLEPLTVSSVSFLMVLLRFFTAKPLSEK